jgi:hypothetical protein
MDGSHQYSEKDNTTQHHLAGIFAFGCLTEHFGVKDNLSNTIPIPGGYLPCIG